MLPFFLTSIPIQSVADPSPIVSSVVVDGSVLISPSDSFSPSFSPILQIAQVNSLENSTLNTPSPSVTLGNISADTTSLSNLEDFPISFPPNYSVTTSTPASPPAAIQGSLPASTQTFTPISPTPFPQRSILTATPTPAQSPATPSPQTSAPFNVPPSLAPLSPLIPRAVTQRHEVRALPGQLNQVPVLNSNSPEEVFGDGILLSTFPPAGKRSPQAHLNLTLEGRFDVFAHHIARTANQEFARPLYLGVLLYNPGSRVVIVDVMQAVAYFTNPDAPFVQLPDYVDNFSGNFFSGPGSRLSTDILRGVHQSRFPNQIILFPGESRMLINEPILIGSAVSSLIRLRSNGPIYAASLSMLALIVPPPPEPPPEPPLPVASTRNDLLRLTPRPNPLPTPPPRPVYRSPIISEWEDLIRNGSLAFPRDNAPTPPNQAVSRVIYGRVSGVALGNLWQGQLVDSPSRQELSIPEQGAAISYAINTLNRGTFGTGQDQSAPMVARYPDTAYRANGNYGIQYSLTLPLYNGTGQMQAVSIAMQTPLKRDDNSQGLQFLEPPPNDTTDVFRGTIQIAYQDDFGLPRTRSVHIVQRRGQQGKPLVTLRMPPGNRRLVTVDFIYPPDATPPQVLTIRTTNPATTVSNQGELNPDISSGDLTNGQDTENLNSTNQNPLSGVGLINPQANQVTSLEAK